MNLPKVPILEMSAARNVVIKVSVKTCERWQLNEEQQLILQGHKVNEGIGWNTLAGIRN